MQDLKVAQSAYVDSATVPLQHHQFELPMDGKDDLETFSMPVSPHDRDVMHKARQVMEREPLVQRFCDLDTFRNFVKNSNPLCDVALGMWLLFSLFSPFSMQNEDRARPSEKTENGEAHALRKFFKNTLFQVLTLVFFGFSIILH